MTKGTKIYNSRKDAWTRVIGIARIDPFVGHISGDVRAGAHHQRALVLLQGDEDAVKHISAETIIRCFKPIDNPAHSGDILS